MKAITENQFHDFLINSRHSCKKYCLHNSTLRGITVTVDPRIKYGLRKGDRLVKSCHLPGLVLDFFFGGGGGGGGYLKSNGFMNIL